MARKHKGYEPEPEPFGKERDNELSDNGLLVFKHKTNKRLFLQRTYRWKDQLDLIDEAEGRQHIMSFPYSSIDVSAWEPVTKEEYEKVKRRYREIYDAVTPEEQISEMFKAVDIAGKIEELNDVTTLLFAQWIGEKGYSKHQSNDRWYDEGIFIGDTACLLDMFKKDNEWREWKDQES